MKLIIAGSRHIADPSIVDRAFSASGLVLDDVEEVVCGGALGVDALGEDWASRHGIPVRHFYPDWASYGRAAGPKRNEQMAPYADALLAIPAPDSRGTRDMIQRAEKHGLTIYMHEDRRREPLKEKDRRDAGN